MISPAPVDPPQIHKYLWEGFGGMVGWDVGANVGNTLGEMMFRFRDVIAFEPATESFKEIEKYTPVSGLKVFQIAVSDHDGVVELVDIPDKIDTGQLVTKVVGMEWNPEQEGATFREVPCRTVDSLVQQFGAPDFLKVDVEGHEGHVLRGAANLLETLPPSWLIEIHAPELGDFCIATLEACGYDVEIVRHPHYERGTRMFEQHFWLKALPPVEG